jgi:hypothetical protein
MTRPTATVDPEIYDTAPAPDGHDCQMWTGDEPTPCDADAEVLFVYQGSLNPAVDKPRNALACADCAPALPKADE